MNLETLTELLDPTRHERIRQPLMKTILEAMDLFRKHEPTVMPSEMVMALSFVLANTQAAFMRPEMPPEHVAEVLSSMVKREFFKAHKAVLEERAKGTGGVFG